MKLRTLAISLLPALLLANAVETLLPAGAFTQPVLGAAGLEARDLSRSGCVVAMTTRRHRM